MTDAEYIETFKSISDPMEALKVVLENEKFFGFDPYYRDIRDAVFVMVERICAASPGAGETPALTASQVQASWDRLRAKWKEVEGDELPAATYVTCDSCGKVKPSELIDHHSPSGINHCAGGCGPPTERCICLNDEALGRCPVHGTTEGSAERCRRCGGGSMASAGLYHEECPRCRGTGAEPSVTKEKP